MPALGWLAQGVEPVGMRQRHGVAGQPRAKQASTRCAVSPSASLRLEQRPESASILRPRVPSLSARHNAPQLRAGERGRRDAARGLLPAAEIRVARHDRNGLTLDWPSSPDSPFRVPSGRMTFGTNVGFGAESVFRFSGRSLRIRRYAIQVSQ